MFQNKIWLIVVLFIVSCASNKFSYTEDPNYRVNNLSSLSLNLDVKKFVLKNGLRVLLVENHRLPIISYYTFYDVGGRHEKKGLYGASHFLEHMMFKGTSNYGHGKFDSIIEGLGGTDNAYTSMDNTVYHESLPSNGLEKIIELEADRMNNLLLKEESFEKERLVILEERRSQYDNNPAGKLMLAMMGAIFEKTPYGKPIIGSMDDIKELKRDEIFRYFRKYYAPNNAIVVIVGDIDPVKTEKLIREKYEIIPPCEDLEKSKEAVDKPILYTPRGRYGREIEIHASNPVPLFAMAYKGVPIGVRKAFVMDILSTILGSGQSSYLSQKYVRNKRPLLSSIGVTNYTLKRSGIFYLWGELLRGVSLKKFKRTLVRETKKMCDRAITERSLQKTKNQYLIDYYNEIQTNSGVAGFLGVRENYLNDYKYYEKELKIYDSITVDETIEVCKEIFDPEEYVFISTWNRHKNKKGKR